jgi:outer membrane protein TolC
VTRAFSPLLLALLASSAAAEAPLMDVDACLRAAFANNPDLTLAQKDLDVARARERTARAALYPAVTFKAEQTRGRADETALEPSFVERLYGVQATQTLFQGGRRWAGARQAGLRSEALELERERRRNALRHDVAEAYWRLASLQAAADAYAEAHRELQEDLEKAARHELSESRSARIEILETRAQNRECALALAETSEQAAEARARLAALMGLRRAEDAAPAPAPAARELALDEAECLRLAVRHRPEPAIAEREAEAAEWGRRAGSSGHYPRVDLNGFWGRSGAAFDQTETFDYRRDWNAGVRVSWAILGHTAGYTAFKERTSPKLGESTRTETETQGVSLSLGDALQNFADSAEGRKTAWERRRRLDDARRDVEEDARLAVRRAASAWRRAESAKARLEQAQQELIDTRHLLREDRAHLGDMAAARNRLAAARAGQALAQGQYRAAVSNLNRAVGVADRFRLEDAP